MKARYACHSNYLKKDNMNKEIKKEIKRLKKKGLNKSQIARTIGIPRSTVTYHLDPRFKKRVIEYHNRKYKTDPKFREKLKELNRLHQKELYKKGKAWKQLHPILTKKRAREYNKRKRTNYDK